MAALPGVVSSRGDWHLAIPVESAAPDEGLDFIRDLCSEEAAWERLREGVGLPPHRRFYDELRDCILPTTGVSIGGIDRIINCGIDRAIFSDYSGIATQIAFYIRQFVHNWRRLRLDSTRCYEIDSPDVSEFAERANKVWEELR